MRIRLKLFAYVSWACVCVCVTWSAQIWKFSASMKNRSGRCYVYNSDEVKRQQRTAREKKSPFWYGLTGYIEGIPYKNVFVRFVGIVNEEICRSPFIEACSEQLCHALSHLAKGFLSFELILLRLISVPLPADALSQCPTAPYLSGRTFPVHANDTSKMWKICLI